MRVLHINQSSHALLVQNEKEKREAEVTPHREKRYDLKNVCLLYGFLVAANFLH